MLDDCGQRRMMQIGNVWGWNDEWNAKCNEHDKRYKNGRLESNSGSHRSNA
jgi:hypothetical protein